MRKANLYQTAKSEKQEKEGNSGLDVYGCEVRVVKQSSKTKMTLVRKLLCNWRKIAESIPQVDMKQSQTLSPRKKKHY